MKGFVELGVLEEFDQVLVAMGVRYPMTIQSAVIGRVLKGQDILALSGTGTGKTLAFALPAVQMVDISKTYAQVFVVTPTRELAIQISDVLKKLAAVNGARVLTVLGGQDFQDQKVKLEKSPHIIVGTPGRVLDHVRRASVNLSGVRFWVLDEVDEMLQRGFLEDIAQLSELFLAKRQTFVCSATLPEEVVSLSKEIMTAPKLVNVSKDALDTENIRHVSVKVSADKKEWALLEILKRVNPYLVIVFCSSKESAVKTEERLSKEGLLTDVLQGDMSQAKRSQVMRKFRKAGIQILVATDLAARGLDVEGVSHVINYELPKDAQQYVHRVGRTGRAGEKGIALTIHTPEEERRVKALEEKLGFIFQRENIAGEELARKVKKTQYKKKSQHIKKEQVKKISAQESTVTGKTQKVKTEKTKNKSSESPKNRKTAALKRKNKNK